MASPAIALRFRDTTPGIDTIQEHRAVLSEQGQVWWGWWKKDFEIVGPEMLECLRSASELDLLIVDRSTRGMFSAKAKAWSIDGSRAVDSAQVPEYYRPHIDQVFGWFLITSLDDLEFRDEIAYRFGDGTFVFLAGKEEPLEAAAPPGPSTPKKCLLHLSDLHFGADYGFLPQGAASGVGETRLTLTDCLKRDLARIGRQRDIAAILVTGDFTTAGDWTDKTKRNLLDEFEALRREFGIDCRQVIAVPGNHDIIRYKEGVDVDVAELALNSQTTYQHERDFRLFMDELCGRDWDAPLDYVQRLQFGDIDLLLCVLNSCKITATKWTEYGYVGTRGLDALTALAREDVCRPTFRFMALHHHLLPVAAVEAPNSSGVSLSLDASGLLDAAQEAGIQVALHGHQHIPRLCRYQTIPLMGGEPTSSIMIVSNGSAGAVDKRLPGSERNVYCVYEFDVGDVHLWMRELRVDGKKEAAQLFDGKLGVAPSAV